MLSKKYCYHCKTTKTYCLSCTKHIDNISSKKVIMKSKVIREVSKCANCVFMKEQGAKGILSSLGFKTPLSKIPVLGDILF